MHLKSSWICKIIWGSHKLPHWKEGHRQTIWVFQLLLSLFLFINHWTKRGPGWLHTRWKTGVFLDFISPGITYLPAPSFHQFWPRPSPSPGLFCNIRDLPPWEAEVSVNPNDRYLPLQNVPFSFCGYNHFSINLLAWKEIQLIRCSDAENSWECVGFWQLQNLQTFTCCGAVLRWHPGFEQGLDIGHLIFW